MTDEQPVGDGVPPQPGQDTDAADTPGEPDTPAPPPAAAPAGDTPPDEPPSRPAAAPEAPTPAAEPAVPPSDAAAPPPVPAVVPMPPLRAPGPAPYPTYHRAGPPVPPGPPRPGLLTPPYPAMPPQRRTVSTSWLVAAVVVALALVGAALYVVVDRSSAASSNASGGGAGGGGTAASQPGPATAGTDPALAAFYDQRLSWHSCQSGDECASFKVPLNYADPTGTTIKLSMVRVPAADQSDRIGSLFVNPGGPGGSAIDYATSPGIVSEAVADRYDIIGLDPRGVGESTPLECVGDQQLDTLVNEDPTPSTPQEIQDFTSETQSFDQACQKAAAAELPYLGTENAARDMDVARALVGDPKLYYLGKSYGTYLGTVYAGLFPQRVGRLVLDGAIDPALTGRQSDLDQARGFEGALNAYVANCLTQRGCPLGPDVQGGLQQIRSFLTGLQTNPLPGDGTRQLNAAEGTTAVIGALYDDQSWPMLTAGLSQAFQGNGGLLLTFADEYNERGPGGHYLSNILQVNPAVNCADRGDNTSVAEVQADLGEFEQASPTFGATLDWSGLVCAYWPVKPEITPGPITAAGAAPILVVGTTRDPATPYDEAQKLATELSSATLLTWNGDGHTAYERGSACIDDDVDAYLLHDQTPPAGTICVGRGNNSASPSQPSAPEDSGSV